MNSAVFFLATAVLGVDYGWQSTDDGQLEYLIQIEPALVRSFEQGQEIVSELPPEVRGVRRFRISVGSGALPREALPGRPEIPAAATFPRGQPQPPLPERVSVESPSTEPGRVEAAAARPIEDLDGAVEPVGGPMPQGDPSREQPTTAESPSDSAVQQALSNDGGNPGNAAPCLIAALVALAASLGGNFYQGWNLASARRRYYQLVDRLGLRGDDGVTIVEA